MSGWSGTIGDLILAAGLWEFDTGWPLIVALEPTTAQPRLDEIRSVVVVLESRRLKDPLQASIRLLLDLSFVELEQNRTRNVQPQGQHHEQDKLKFPRECKFVIFC